MKIKLTMEKETKNTIRFTEEVASIVDTPKIGTIYVPKPTLKDVGWTEGKKLIVDITTE